MLHGSALTVALEYHASPSLKECNNFRAAGSLFPLKRGCCKHALLLLSLLMFATWRDSCKQIKTLCLVTGLQFTIMNGVCSDDFSVIAALLAFVFSICIIAV